MEPEILLAIGAVILVVITTLSGFLIRGRRGDAPPRDAREGGGGTGTATRERPRADADDGDVAVAEPPAATAPAPTAPPRAPEPEAPSLGERFRQQLARTRNVLGVSVAELFGRGVSDDAWEGLEETLIASDVGVSASLEIVEQVRTRARDEGVTDAAGVVDLLKQELRAVLDHGDRSLARATDGEPTVWMLTGVNGTGKTTTIGKLAAIESRAGNSVVLAAADTFRAAAAEQLGLWADRTDARLVRKDEGADPASVAYDGYMAAKATDADLLIVDTAGRLQNRRELMDELGKVKRVVEKQSGPMEEVLLVLDATTGQNGLSQASAFLDAVAITGLVLTKLDGSSKGGIVVAVQRELGVPVKLVGLGEGIDDLAPFDPRAFVDSLFE